MSIMKIYIYIYIYIYVSAYNISCNGRWYGAAWPGLYVYDRQRRNSRRRSGRRRVETS
jgi:hypothetical protein